MAENLNNLSVLREENQRLRLVVEELSILNDLARVISSTMSLDVVIENIIKRSVKAINCKQGMITLIDGEKPTGMRTLIRTLDSSTNHEQFHLNQNILGWMLINKKPLTCDDIRNDTRFSGVKFEENICSLLCVPLLVKNRLIGILAMFNKKESKHFSQEDSRLLSIIAMQSAQILENARLYQEEQKKMVLDREMIAAREVQMSLLPKHIPKVSHLEFAAKAIPARDVGGDFYDIIQLKENLYEIVIADVAGKGLSAALLASLGKGVLCSQVIQKCDLPKQLEISNQILRGSLPAKSFITMLLGCVNASTRGVKIVNAGHCYPILFNAEENVAKILPVRGMALNITDKLIFEETSVQLAQNDCLIFYSDGLTEAQNKKEEFFEEARLLDSVRKNAMKSAENIISSVLTDIKAFVDDHPQVDDVTMIVVKAI